MDYGLGIEVLLQQVRRAKSKGVSPETPSSQPTLARHDVPAETSPPHTVHPSDVVWASIEDCPLYQEEQARIAERQRMYAEEDRYYRRRERQRASRSDADTRAG